MQIWAKMELTRMYKTNDFKISYPKSALSSSLTAGCGLKLEMKACKYDGGVFHPA